MARNEECIIATNIYGIKLYHGFITRAISLWIYKLYLILITFSSIIVIYMLVKHNFNFMCFLSQVPFPKQILSWYTSEVNNYANHIKSLLKFTQPSNKIIHNSFITLPTYSQTSFVSLVQVCNPIRHLDWWKTILAIIRKCVSKLDV